MGENLNVKTAESWCYGEDGEVYIEEMEDWKTLTSSEIRANCAKYGRLYTWEAARTACPSGWRLPDTADWRRLVEAAGGLSTAGKKLKAASGWNSNGNGTDNYGFSALLGGLRYSDGHFDFAGGSGLWWTATEYDGSYAYGRGMFFNGDYVREDFSLKDRAFSVRCIAD